MKIFLEFFKIELKTFCRDPIAIFWTFLFPFIILFTVMSTSGKHESVELPRIVVLVEERMDVTDISSRIDQVFPELTNSSVNFVSSGLENVLSDFKRNNIVVDVSACADVGLSCAGVDVYYASSPDDLTLMILNILRQNQQFLVPSESVLWRYVEQNIDHKSQVKWLQKARQLTIGLICLNIVSICLFGFSVILVELRQNDGLKFFQVMPVRKSVFISAFTLSRVVIINVFALFFLLVSNFTFELDINFSAEYFLKFIFMVSIGSATFVSLGVLLASRLTSVGAVNGLINLVYFPLIFTSGIFFPVLSDSKFLNFVSNNSPLRGYSDMFYSVYFVGRDLILYSGSVLTLLGWCVLSGFVAFKMFIWVKKD
ncbi:ABC transporter permease [Rheinheimera muenzenbergensis]|uniref:ABC transporter permease n=1 Tax=Rheinheimera muenzenbergensis TaxID=1193628 RepID=A0ABU8C581_9GAMM